MIVYYKLANILKERNMQWKDLCQSGISINTPTKFSQNKNVSTDTIDKICTFLHIQPSDMMEWIPNEEYEKKLNAKQDEEKQALKKQIAELQAKLKNM